MKTWLRNILKLFTQTKVSEPLCFDTIDTNKITILCKYPEMLEFIKLLKVNRDNLCRVEMLDIGGEKTLLRKGEVITYEQLIANISDVRKEEIVYARKSEGSNSK